MTRRRLFVIAAIAVGILVVAVLAHIVLPALAWSGAVVVELKVLVRDHVTEKPVEGAAVVFVRPGGNVPMGETGPEGLASITWAFGAGGTSRVLYKTYSFYTGAHTIRCSKEGYLDAEVPVSKEPRLRYKRVLGCGGPPRVMRVDVRLQAEPARR